MKTLLVPFVVSAAVTLLLVRSAPLHGSRSGDRDFSKPQKVHVHPVPRIGGFGMVMGMVALAVWWWLTDAKHSAVMVMTLLGCAAPAFLSGFVQDFTEAVTPRGRLLATAVSAALAFYLIDAAIHRTDIPALDWVAAFGVGSLLLTVFAVAGLAHAVNIIDGINGLAAMCGMLMLAAIAYVAFQAGDDLLVALALSGIGAVLGFFLWNFPFGLIFMGDGGAYFLGFVIAELGILLIARNPDVSPLFPLLVCIYPAFETLFSIYRRWVLRARPAHLPDGIHLHSLMYRRVMRWALHDRSAAARTRRNSMTSPILWLLCMVSIIPAMLWWDDSTLLALSLVGFGFVYIGLYWRIVRFRSPRVLHMLRPRAHSLRAGEERRS